MNKENINSNAKHVANGRDDRAKVEGGVTGSNITEHTWLIKQVLEEYHVNINLDKPQDGPGLTTEEAAERLTQDGANILTPPKQVPGIVKFLEGFTNVFMILLMVAGSLSIIAWALDQTVTINLVLGCILFGIVIITVFVEFIQGRKADRVMKVFRSLLPANCKVIRDGREQTVPASTLVKGDLVHIQIGDKVPADLRVIWAANAKVERSSMTGEAEPEPMTTDCTSERIVETKNLGFSGSLMINGEAYGIVVRTGDQTLIGKIAGLASKKSNDVHKKSKLCGLLGNPGEPTLVVEVKRFVFIISCMAIIMAIVFFVIGIATGVPPLFAFINGFIVVLIANIPQGLPATVTSCLSIASNRLAKRNVLVKRMNTIETLGAANVICSDKTGTLTMNQMTVMNMWFDQSFLPAKSTMELGNQFIHSKTYLSLFRIAALCNRAYFDKPTDPAHEAGLEVRRRSLEREGFTEVRPSIERARGPRPSIELTHDNKFEITIHRGATNVREPFYKPTVEDDRTEGRLSLEAGRPSIEHTGGKQSLELINFEQEARIDTTGKVIVGDASETALFRYTSTFSDVDAIRARFPKVFEIPFNSTNKWQLSIHDTHGTKKKHLLVIKGAPERILTKCSKVLINGRKIIINDGFREQYDCAYKTFGGAGERVLGFAQKKFLPPPHIKYNELEPNFPTEGYTFIGLVSLEDPPRDGVPEAIHTCHEAGIKVIMVTGDHPFTAEAIARKVGIIGIERTREEVAKLRGCNTKEIGNDEYGAVIVPGSEIDSLTEEDWDSILRKPEIVFARTSPQQKLEIVKNNQRRGNVVAVTGDGVNDSPALKQADLGIAMGISVEGDMLFARTVIKFQKKVAIFVGSVIFSIWCSFYSVHDDEHSHIDNEHNDHEHLHSTEQNELLKTVPMHKHLHFHRRKKPESHNSILISDAAASATAYACGIKTKNRRIGKDVDSNDCGTLLEAAKKKGMRTAIVSSDVTFASSAAFVSHVADRGDYTDVAEQMLDWKRVGEKDIYGRDITLGVDLILGGGRRVFTGKNERVLSKAIEMGYTYTTNMTDFLAEKDVEVRTKEVNLPLLGLFDDEHIDYEVDRNKDETPNLAELTRRGLEIMERASNGFIMVVSGHGIQSACLQGDPGALYGELLSWDAAVAEAVNFIKEKSTETLLLVLSDLDTAGLTLAYPGESTWDPRAVLDQRGSIESIVQKIAERHYNETELEQLVEQRLGITLVYQECDLVEANQDNATSLYPVLSTMVTKRAKITWSSTSNTGQDVNMFVHGRGAEEFKGNLDNAQISRMLDGLMTMKVEEITAHLNGQDSTVKK